MIQKMFPSINFGTLASEDLIVNRDYSANDEPQVFIPQRVWDSEYKESIKALEQEPIIKEDLGMEYKSQVFDDMLSLTKFLNHNKIPPQNIISVHRNNICYGYGTVELLYMVESKDSNRNPFLD